MFTPIIVQSFTLVFHSAQPILGKITDYAGRESLRTPREKRKNEASKDGALVEVNMHQKYIIKTNQEDL